MTTVFDVLTVASFVGLVIAFFFWTERDLRTLLHFALSGIVLAVANQTGNSGYFVLTAVLIIAAVAYAAITAFRREL